MTSVKLPYWLIVVVTAIYAFLHAPLLVLMVFSFNVSKITVNWEGFTFHWYLRLLEREDILSGLINSIIVGIGSTLISTVLGTLMAMALARHQFRGRQVMEALLYVPIVTPEVVVGVSLLILFALTYIPMGLVTIIIAHVAFNISFVAVVVHARLQGMDRNLEEAAMILGADELTAFWRVTVPQLWPGILSGAMLAFTMSFDDYVITKFVSDIHSQTLPIVVYTMVAKNLEPSVNAISTIILVVTTMLIIFANRITREKSLTTEK